VNIDVAQIFIAFIVLLFSLTVHEMAHAWTADRLGDPTARLLGASRSTRWCTPTSSAPSCFRSSR
jgi:Zn-dependent protease